MRDRNLPRCGYREVRANLVQAAGTRAQATADQLAALFAQSTQQRLNEFQRVADHATLRRLLEQPDDGTREAARSHLAQVRSAGPQILEVWNAARERVLSWRRSRQRPVTWCLPARCRPSGVAPLQRRVDHVFTESTVEIGAGAASCAAMAFSSFAAH